jgi:exopolyphosphatase/guanosine-5'-triphosphate,3'-diphosphate pyrophosphatase
MARLVALLRLSLRLHRSRSEAPLGTVGLSVRENLMLLAVPNAYLRAHPLTRAELQAEADQLPALGLTLTVAEV